MNLGPGGHHSNARFPLELHVVHHLKDETDFLNTPKGLAVTGFFFEVDGVSGEGGETVERSLIISDISGQRQPRLETSHR